MSSRFSGGLQTEIPVEVDPLIRAKFLVKGDVRRSIRDRSRLPIAGRARSRGHEVETKGGGSTSWSDSDPHSQVRTAIGLASRLMRTRLPRWLRSWTTTSRRYPTNLRGPRGPWSSPTGITATA